MTTITLSGEEVKKALCAAIEERFSNLFIINDPSIGFFVITDSDGDEVIREDNVIFSIDI